MCKSISESCLSRAVQALGSPESEPLIHTVADETQGESEGLKRAPKTTPPIPPIIPVKAMAGLAEPLLSRLEGVRPAGTDQWYACCPAHGDRTPSLSIREAGDRVLIQGKSWASACRSSIGPAAPCFSWQRPACLAINPSPRPSPRLLPGMRWWQPARLYHWQGLTPCYREPSLPHRVEIGSRPPGVAPSSRASDAKQRSCCRPSTLLAPSGKRNDPGGS